MLKNASGILLFAVGLAAQVPSSSVPHSATGSQLESFYVVSSDGGSRFTIIDVQPASPSDSSVRFIKVYPACGTYHVQAEAYVFENVSVHELAGEADLCGSEKTFSAVVSAAKHKAVEEAWQEQYAVASQCGSETVVHHLLWREYLHFDALEAKAPQIAALWTLSDNISNRGDKERANQRLADAGLKQVRLERHRIAEQAAIEIRGGDFDVAVPKLPLHWRTEGKSRLSDIVPEVAEATAPEEDFGVVENLDHLGVENYENIQYPQMAKIAHIGGGVNLAVSIDPASGLVIGVAANSGHPILKQRTIEAIKKWVFLHPYFGANPLPVNIHFEVHCPPIVETNTMSVKKSREKSKKKRKP